MDLEAIKQLAFENLGNRSSHPWKEPGNKYYHGERVAKLILLLRKHVLPEDDSHDEILTVAAWFHDIRNGVENHAEEGAKRAREVLAGTCTAYELDEICAIIGVHDNRHSDRSLFSDYVKLHQDADLLDHFGTYDVWTEFFHAAHHSRTIQDVMEWFQKTRRDQGEQYRSWMNFDISRTILDEKNAFVMSFGERFNVEGSGGIWRETELLKTVHR